MGKLDQGENRLDAVEFRRAITDAYFRKFRKSATNTTLYPGNRLLHNPASNFRYDICGHWIIKGAQRRCALCECKGTSKSFCEKCAIDCIQAVFNYTIFLECSEYKRLDNSFCIKSAFVFVCVNKS